MNIEKLYPAYKDYLWGGEKLKTKYGKNTDTKPLAESWELSFHEAGPTHIADGRTLAEAVTPEDLGKKCRKFDGFPLMIKLIDAKDDLSVQVHPSDDYALKNEKSFGKTEMWYIVEAEENAGIYIGFKRKVSREELEEAIKNNSVTELLNFVKVKAGESYFIPSGTVHAICKGCLICEIQQNSNLTYRLYDYGRKDKNGNVRELHVKQALAVANLNKFRNKKFYFNILGKCRYFKVKKLTVENKKVLKKNAGSFRCVTCVTGEGEINGIKFSRGDSFFISALCEKVELTGNAGIILTEI